jgi:hypothetical protein
LGVVTPDRVRNRVNLSSSDISDSVVTEFIVDACAEIKQFLEAAFEYVCEKDGLMFFRKRK